MRQLFTEDKFGNDSKIDLEDLNILLNVDDDHRQFDISAQNLSKLLDIERYRDKSWSEPKLDTLDTSLMNETF